MDEVWVLRLYVTGRDLRSLRAFTNLQRLCDEHLPDRYRIDVIDVRKNPSLAKEHDVIATPMVVREAPVPFRKLIGDLSDAQRVLLCLGFPSPAALLGGAQTLLSGAQT